MANDSDTVELRGDIPKNLMAMVDAVSTAKRVSRMSLVRKILNDWAVKTYHEAMIVERVTKGNPPLVAIDWQDTEV
jgi:hypothetical protein